MAHIDIILSGANDIKISENGGLPRPITLEELKALDHPPRSIHYASADEEVMKDFTEAVIEFLEDYGEDEDDD